MEYIGIAFLSVVGILLTLWRVIGTKNLIKHNVKIDIGITILLAFMFLGTFSGTVTALFGGLFSFVILSGLKKIHTSNSPNPVEIFKEEGFMSKVHTSNSPNPVEISKNL